MRQHDEEGLGNLAKSPNRERIVGRVSRITFNLFRME